MYRSISSCNAVKAALTYKSLYNNKFIEIDLTARGALSASNE